MPISGTFGLHVSFQCNETDNSVSILPSLQICNRYVINQKGKTNLVSRQEIYFDKCSGACKMYFVVINVSFFLCRNDASEFYYDFIWDITLLEFVVRILTLLLARPRQGWESTRS